MTQRFVWQEGDFVVVRPDERPRGDRAPAAA